MKSCKVSLPFVVLMAFQLEMRMRYDHGSRQLMANKGVADYRRTTRVSDMVYAGIEERYGDGGLLR